MARAVAVSDLHLVYEGTEREAIQTLIQELEDDPPDELILNGDIYELWRGDLAGVMWLSSRWTTMLEDLCDRGVECTYIQGNHDDYLSRHLDDNPDYPFKQQLDYWTELDGEEFFFTHGHKYEPTYIPPTNTALSLTDDHMGNVADWLWDNRPAPDSPVENVALALLGPAGSFFDPDDIQTNNVRARFIERGIRQESGDAWGIFGHTHTPYVSPEEKVANTGSMTSGQATYIEIIDGVPKLQEV